VQCKRKVGGGGNVRALSRFPACSPKRKEEMKVSNLTDWYILYFKCNASCTQIVGRNGRPAGTHAWVPVTDGLLAFRSLIILERSDVWLCLGRRSPSMCPHATGTWIAVCGFQGTASPSLVQTLLASAPINKCEALSVSKGPPSSACGTWLGSCAVPVQAHHIYHMRSRGSCWY